MKLEDSWNYHLIQIGEHIDAMERWIAEEPDPVKQWVMRQIIKRLRDQVKADRLPL